LKGKARFRIREVTITCDAAADAERQSRTFTLPPNELIEDSFQASDMVIR